MALALMRLYTALKNAGASDTDATAAAEEVAGFENRLAKLETDLTVLKWMVGFTLATTIAILFRVFTK
jgi:hypothetical protein